MVYSKVKISHVYRGVCPADFSTDVEMRQLITINADCFLQLGPGQYLVAGKMIDDIFYIHGCAVPQAWDQVDAAMQKHDGLRTYLEERKLACEPWSKLQLLLKGGVLPGAYQPTERPPTRPSTSSVFRTAYIQLLKPRLIRMKDPSADLADPEVECFFKPDSPIEVKESNVHAFISQEGGVEFERSRRSVLAFLVAKLAGSSVIARNWNVLSPAFRVAGRTSPYSFVVGNCMVVADARPSFVQASFEVGRVLTRVMIGGEYYREGNKKQGEWRNIAVINQASGLPEVSQKLFPLNTENMQDYGTMAVKPTDKLKKTTLVPPRSAYPSKQDPPPVFLLSRTIKGQVCPADFEACSWWNTGLCTWNGFQGSICLTDRYRGTDLGSTQSDFVSHVYSYHSPLGFYPLYAQLTADKDRISEGFSQIVSDVTELQLLDSICFQVDRHGGNYFVNSASPKLGVNSVVGIDLDMSFTSVADTDFVTLLSDQLKLPQLPAQVSRATFNRIMGISDTGLDLVFKEAGWDSSSQVYQLALKRLGLVKAHLQSLANSGGVVDQITYDVYNSATQVTKDNSYFSRDYIASVKAGRAFQRDGCESYLPQRIVKSGKK